MWWNAGLKPRLLSRAKMAARTQRWRVFVRAISAESQIMGTEGTKAEAAHLRYGGSLDQVRIGRGKLGYASRWLGPGGLRTGARNIFGPYLHVVFTVPEEMAEIALQNKRTGYGVPFHANC